MTLQERLARETLALCFEDLPGEVVHEVKRRIMDSLACAIGALRSEIAQIGRRVAQRVSVPDGATLWGTGHKTSPDLAAFVNGALVRYWDFNDTYLSEEPAHPSDNIAPCFAVAEAFRRSGRDLITAIALAYEVQCRLADAASLRRHGFDHVNYGLFSVTCGAAKLMGLTEQETSHALAIAGVAHLATRQTRVGEISPWKAFAFSNVARNAIFATLLAREGMTGPRQIFEGKFGFFRKVSGEFKLAPMAWSEGGEGRFKILETYIKAFPAEYHAQTAIEAALHLRPQIPSPDDIVSVRIDTHEAAYSIIGSEPEKWRPKTRETADHSLPYLVAVALSDGEVSFSQFSPERLSDPKLHSLIDRIEVRLDPELDAEYPRAFPNRVTVTLRDGTQKATIKRWAKGHPKRPMSDADLEEKLWRLSEGILRPEQVKALVDLIWRLEELDEVGQISDLLRL